MLLTISITLELLKSRKENPQKLTQLSGRSHPRHLVGKRTAQKDTIIDITSDSQVNSNFPYRWSPASLTFSNYFYLLTNRLGIDTCLTYLLVWRVNCFLVYRLSVWLEIKKYGGQVKENLILFAKINICIVLGLQK